MATATKQTNREKAAARYKELSEQVKGKLDALIEAVEDHEPTAPNYAHVGDLAHVDEVLNEIAAFICGGKK